MKDNLAPIRYSVRPISELFGRVEGLDAKLANTMFNDYVAMYCNIHSCLGPTPDRPDPPGPVVSFLRGESVHGEEKGQPFTTVSARPTAGWRIKKLLTYRRGNIDGLQFVLGDGLTEATSLVVKKAEDLSWTAPAGDEIKCVNFGVIHKTGQMEFNSMQITTVRGEVSDIIKGSYQPTSYQTICKPSDKHHIIGFFGLYDHTFSEIGF